MLVLLVEDHILLAETIMDYLSFEEIEVDHASRGLRGLELSITNTYDAIMLDVNLPEIDGFSICRRLREEHDIVTPIIMMTARDQLDDRLKGFSAGADDYLVKPFENKELVARLSALVKRRRTGMDFAHSDPSLYSKKIH